MGWPAWSKVQPEIAKWTRACCYDRAGTGCSEPGPMPRTSLHIAEELHTALHHAGIVALGAGRLRILNMILLEAFVLLAIGIVVGLGLAVALGKTASSLLFGVKPADPITLGLAAALLAAVAVAASYIPARRASKVDPMVALRYE
jgi:hypothetical protein